MQNVPRSRAAFGHVAQNVARSSRYDAAAFGSQPRASAGAAPRATAPSAPNVTMASVATPNGIASRRSNFMVTFPLNGCRITKMPRSIVAAPASLGARVLRRRVHRLILQPEHVRRAVSWHDGEPSICGFATDSTERWAGGGGVTRQGVHHPWAREYPCRLQSWLTNRSCHR